MEQFDLPSEWQELEKTPSVKVLTPTSVKYSKLFH